MKNLLLIIDNNQSELDQIGDLTNHYELSLINSDEILNSDLDEIYPEIIILYFKNFSIDHLKYIKILKKNFPETPILIFDFSTNNTNALEALKTGAIGYYSLADSNSNLLEIINNSLQGETHLPKILAEELTTPDLDNTRSKINNSFFTTKELIFLTLIRDSESNLMISEKLNISVNRINFLIRNIYRKLHFYYNVNEVL